MGCHWTCDRSSFGSLFSKGSKLIPVQVLVEWQCQVAIWRTSSTFSFTPFGNIQLRRTNVELMAENSCSSYLCVHPSELIDISFRNKIEKCWFLTPDVLIRTGVSLLTNKNVRLMISFFSWRGWSIARYSWLPFASCWCQALSRRHASVTGGVGSMIITQSTTDNSVIYSCSPAPSAN